ncbi:hypothetical protein [Rhodospirillum sp. A1_3_36]
MILFDLNFIGDLSECTEPVMAVAFKRRNVSYVRGVVSDGMTGQGEDGKE